MLRRLRGSSKLSESRPAVKFLLGPRILVLTIQSDQTVPLLLEMGLVCLRILVGRMDPVHISILACGGDTEMVMGVE